MGEQEQLVLQIRDSISQRGEDEKEELLLSILATYFNANELREVIDDFSL